jgi:transcriptional regulator with XRE-family HTH domain
LNSIPELVSARQSKGLTLEQIADTTKISMRYLRAIEEGRLAVLPGGVYTINYLRQYAAAIECGEGLPMPQPVSDDAWKQAVLAWTKQRPD